MALKTLGKVFLNGIQFTNDPKIKRSWASRQSVFSGLSGASTVQDFGRFAKDKILTLSSDGNYINAATKRAIDALAGSRGPTYDYSDYTGTTGTVKILSFEATPTFIRDGGLVLYEYELSLKIMTLSLLDGVAYTGS